MNKFNRILSSKETNNMTSSSQNLRTYINFTEIEIAKIENDLFNWTIPKININKIYDGEEFSIYNTLAIPFKQNIKYSVKTIKQITALNQENESIRLLSENVLIDLKKKYNYLHIGSVQMAIKPLFRLGLDVPILMCL